MGFQTLKKAYNVRFTAAPMIGRTDDGDPIYGDRFHFRGRLEKQFRKAIGPDGNEIELKHTIYTFGDMVKSKTLRAGKDPISWDDLIWFPGKDTDDIDCGEIVLTVGEVPTLGVCSVRNVHYAIGL